MYVYSNGILQVKIYSVNSYKMTNGRNLPKNQGKSFPVSFCAVIDGDKKEHSKAYNAIKDVFLRESNAKAADSIVTRFELGYRSIKEASKERLSQVGGFFKTKKRMQILRDEDYKISGFLKAQEIALEIQDENLELLKQNYELLKQRNTDAKELQEVKKALLMAEQIRQKTQILSQNKNSHKGFDSIAGYEEEKFLLTERFINLLPYEMAGQDVEMPNAILFFGPAGNGKTSFAKAFAHSANCEFKKAEPSPTARSRKDKEKTFYDNLLAIAKMSQQNFLENGVRTIILVDEADRFMNSTSSIVQSLKRFLENCSQDYHCTIFATTNNPLDIPSALRSSSRMPIKVAIDPPDKINSALVFEHYLKDCPNVNMDEINLAELAEEVCSVLPNRAYNNSQIEDICKECVKHCSEVSQEDLLYYIRKESPKIDKESLEKYKNEVELIVGGTQND